MTLKKTVIEGNFKELSDTNETLIGKYGGPGVTVMNREGKQFTEVLEKRNRWVEHFELLNRPTS